MSKLLTWAPSFKVVVKKDFSLFYKVINLVLVEATTVAQLSDADMVLVPFSKLEIKTITNL